MVLPNPNMIPPGPMPPPMPMGGSIGGPPPPMMDPAMMGAPPPGMPMDPMMGGMMPQGIPGFPPGVTPDMNYPGSMAQRDAELMLAMQDPNVAIALIKLILGEIDPDPGPKYPAWYDKDHYPKPKASEIRSGAEQDRELHRLLIRRMAHDRDRIRMAVVGAFDDFDEDVEEKYTDASLAIDVHLIVSILAACDFIFTKTAKRSGEAQDAQDIENLCYALFEQTLARHHGLHGTDLKADTVKISLATGHLYSRVLPNYYPEEGEIPIQVDLLDSASCYPTIGSHGLEAMKRIYKQTVAEVCQGFGLKRKQRNQLLSKMQKTEKGEERQRKLSDTVEVVEYWDCRWFALDVDSESIIAPVEHGLGRVPFVRTLSAIGDAGPVYEQNLDIGYGLSIESRQRDLANKGQSHIQLLQKTHEQREAIYGVVMTEVKKLRNPPRTFMQAITKYGNSPLVSNAPGGISMLAMGEEEEVPNTPDPRFSLLGPVLANVNESAQMGRMSPADYGLAPGSQSSGTVVEGLSESSKDKLNLWKSMIQNHWSGIDELALAILRDHGRKLGPEGKRGEPLYVERQHPAPNEDGYFEFDYRKLRNDSCKVRVQMTSLRMQNLGSLGNAVQMWTQMGRMTDEEALSLRGVRDPHAYMRQVAIEGFKKTPEYQTAKLLEWMKQEGEGPEVQATVMYLLATKGGSGGQQPQPPGPGPMPGNGGAPPTVGMPGGPGQMGGPPMQVPGPPPDLGGIP